MLLQDWGGHCRARKITFGSGLGDQSWPSCLEGILARRDTSVVVMGCRRARALGWPCWQVTVKSSDRIRGQSWCPRLVIPARRAEGTRGTPWLLSRKQLRCQIAPASLFFSSCWSVRDGTCSYSPAQAWGAPSHPLWGVWPLQSVLASGRQAPQHL